MSHTCSVPDRMENEICTLDWNDTFLNLDHLKACFPDYTVRVKTTSDGSQVKPPFRFVSIHYLLYDRNTFGRSPTYGSYALTMVHIIIIIII